MKKIFALLFSLCLFSTVAQAQDITLYPKDAKLTFAPSVIIEPATEPFNLGGWRYDNVVAFPVENIEGGIYEITLVYSRVTDFTMPMRFVVVKDLEKTTMDDSQAHFDFLLAPTNATSWDSYVTKSIGGVSLPQGSFYLGLVPHVEGANYGEYVMNLREVRLKKIQ